MSIELWYSKDGSHTLYHSVLNETYHSTKGAISESKYVYLEQGVGLIKKDFIRVIEVGMGTGLNLLLLYQWALQSNKKVEVYTIEPFPLNDTILSQLNYTQKENSTAHFFSWLHQKEWNELHQYDTHFSIKKINQLWLAAEVPKDYFDCCFYDAFAPSKQPDMWTLECFEKVQSVLQLNGFLTTYCAQGAFKRTIQSMDGFKLEVLPGPLYKKEMTHAIRIK